MEGRDGSVSDISLWWSNNIVALAFQYSYITYKSPTINLDNVIFLFVIYLNKLRIKHYIVILWCFVYELLTECVHLLYKVSREVLVVY